MHRPETCPFQGGYSHYLLRFDPGVYKKDEEFTDMFIDSKISNLHFRSIALGIIEGLVFIGPEALYCAMYFLGRSGFSPFLSSLFSVLYFLICHSEILFV